MPAAGDELHRELRCRSGSGVKLDRRPVVGVGLEFARLDHGDRRREGAVVEADVLLGIRQVAVHLVVLGVARNRDVVGHEVELQELTGRTQGVDLRLTELEAQRQLVEVTVNIGDDLTLRRRVAAHGDRVSMGNARQCHTGTEQARSECERGGEPAHGRSLLTTSRCVQTVFDCCDWFLVERVCMVAYGCGIRQLLYSVMMCA